MTDQSGAPRKSTLEVLLDEAAGEGACGSDRERAIAKRLATLRERLAQHRFQLAVVGQFKRGKSSLLNALLGAEVLPTGVVPLTAIATFIAAGSPGLRVRLSDGGEQAWTAESASDLRARLAEFVTEPANPENVKRVARVDIALASPLLDDGLVLIDTPGVGSSHRHNTDAAEAALPECDAALVVLSPDPPITEVELAYLAKVRRSAVALIIVLNKADTLDGSELAAVLEFTREALSRSGNDKADVLALSARQALKAKLEGDAQGLETSGLTRLEARLGILAGEARRTLMMEAIARKAEALIGELGYENELVLAASKLPTDELDSRLAAFRETAVAFEAERVIAQDLIAGDRRRLLAEVDQSAAALAAKARDDLSTALDNVLTEDHGAVDVGEKVLTGAPALFEQAFGIAVADSRIRLTEALRSHQRRTDALLERVRRAAAGLLDAPYRAPESETAFALRQEPSWVDRPLESLGALHAGAFEALLPAAWRRRRARARLLEQIGEVVARNVERLRWSMRQTIEDGLRGFAVRLDSALRDGLGAVEIAVGTARDLRAGESHAAAEEIAIRTGRQSRLDALASRLRSVGAPPALTGSDPAA